jgi:8-oxo-dGTP diphosphatase
MDEREDEEAFLSHFNPDEYPRMAVTVDIVLLTRDQGRLSVVLIRRGRHPYKGSWALPGGFVELDEDADQAAARELAEETGIELLPTGVRLEQLRCYSAPDRDPRMRAISIAYVVSAPDVPVPRAGDDAETARLWPLSEVTGEGGPKLAFDHAHILADAVEWMQAASE